MTFTKAFICFCSKCACAHVCDHLFRLVKIINHSLNAASPTLFIMSKEAYFVENGTCMLNDFGWVRLLGKRSLCHRVADLRLAVMTAVGQGRV